MTNQIKDGSGKGFLAKVTSNQKLLVEATVFTNMHTVSNDQGQAYVITTDFIDLTDTSVFHGILYVQNNATRHLHLELVLSGEDSLTKWQFLRNPITGTLVSAANLTNETNLNFISNNIAELTAYQGFEGATVSGLSAANWIAPPGGFPIFLGGAIVLGPSDSIGFAAKPSLVGSVNMSVMMYFDPEEQ